MESSARGIQEVMERISNRLICSTKPINTPERFAVYRKGKKSAGLDMDKGKPLDMLKLGVVETLRVKDRAIQSAAEAAAMILRIA